ncbi:MAG: hypothetical protein RIT06_808 [Chloroflexota bacterium]|jgi:uncharacterized membrane protein YhaH (DUF805 family)
MDLGTSVKRNLTTSAYAQFSGRASRSEYWWFALFTLIAQAAATIVDVSIGLDLFANLLTLAFLIPSFALLARRLHDVGRSGWWWLLVFTIIGAFVVLYWLIRPGDAGANKFGDPSA